MPHWPPVQTLTGPPRTSAWPLVASVIGALSLVVVGCAGQVQQDSATPGSSAEVGPLEPSEPFGLTSVTLRSADGEAEVPVPVYDAFEPGTRQRGLMGREELPAGTGMVFRFPAEHTGGFWMKNTLIPLSIAYLDEQGSVLAVMDMEPCTYDPCPSYDPKLAYTATLEVNQGFFDEVGLQTGWQVDIPGDLPPAT